MERLDPAVHHLGKAGVRRPLRGPGCRPLRDAAACRRWRRVRRPPAAKLAGKLDQPRLVADADNRSFDLGRRHFVTAKISESANQRENACVPRFRHSMAHAGSSFPLPPKPARHDSTSRRPFQRATPGHRPPLRPRSSAKGRRSFLRSQIFARESLLSHWESRTQYPVLSTKNPPPRPCVPNSARRKRHATREPPTAASAPYSQRSVKRIFIVRRRQESPASSRHDAVPSPSRERGTRGDHGRFSLGRPARRPLRPQRTIVTVLPNRTPPTGRRSHNQHVCPSVFPHDCRKPIPPCERLNARPRSPASRPAIPPPICGENQPQLL